MNLWEKILDLKEWVEDMEENQREFVENIYETYRQEKNSKPQSEFWFQVQGKSERWINWLYAFYVLGEENPQW